MRTISKQRIGEYLKTSIEVLYDNKNEYPTRLLISEIQKRLQPSGYEITTTKSGAIRWITKFRFWTVGFVKGGYIKKENKKWYLTKSGESLLNKTELELVEITDKAYGEWEKGREDIEKKTAEEVLKNTDPIDISPINLRIKPQPITFNDLIKGVDKSTIQIPPFQRSFVWTAKAITELLDSIYNGYPIGSFIFWQTLKRLPRHREIGGEKLADIAPGSLINYIIDGQQRITSLYAAVKCAEIEDERLRFYFDLTTGSFNYSRIKNDEDDEDSQFEIDPTLIPLDKLFVNSAEYYSYVENFPSNFRPVLHDLYTKFNEYAFSVIYIQNEDEDRNIENNRDDIESIVKIFSRINDTGKKLTVVAKMVAKCWEKNFNLRDKLNELLPPGTPLAEIRDETILQICSVILNGKKCRTKVILEDTNIKELEEKWDKIISSFKLAIAFLNDRLKIKSLKYLPFDSVMVPLAYFHFYNNNPSAAQSDALEKWFWQACLSNRYSSTVEAKIEQDCVSFDKIISGEKIVIDYLIDWDGLRQNLINQNYHFRNAFCKTILALYSYQQPRQFKDGRSVDIVNSISDYSRSHLHHMFPKKFLSINDYNKKDLKDSIVNIVFAPAIVNWEMSDRAPSEYLGEFKKENKELDKVLESHLIKNEIEFGLDKDNFDLFLNKRAESIEKALQHLTGRSSKTEKTMEDDPGKPIDYLENKMRFLVDDVFTEDFPNYWEEAVPKDIQDAVGKKIKNDIKRHPYKKEIDFSNVDRLSYLDVMDYFKIILSNWSYFSEIFGSKPELERHFLALKEYRNTVKHTRKLDPVVAKNGEAAILWFERVFDNYENN